MLQQININSSEISKKLPENFKVLDVGGAGAPFKRANYVIDILPFEEINHNQERGSGEILFTKDTYVQHDICDRTPWPYPDKFFDYSFCSHVLEDIRDPLWVCSEIMRVSKAGYIETPSRLFETTFNLEAKGLSGASHHRWLVDVFEGKLRFTFKYFHIYYPFINKNKRKLAQKHDEMLLRVEWKDSFDFYENWLNSGKEIFEYYLGHEITEKEKWRLYRKVSPYGFFSSWARYLKNTSPFFNDLYLKLFK
jgi:hypothetical protein